MRSKTLPPEQRFGRKGGGFVPALFHVLGIVLILAVIAACIPLTVPKFFGYEIYSIVSGSMRPEYPVGTVVYVKAAEPAQVEEGQVIAFVRDNSIVVHRVVQNRTVEGRFITKGDANEINDIDPVPYDNLVGRVEKKFPLAGHFLSIFNSFVGKIYFLGVALIGVLFVVLSGMLKDKRGKDMKEKELMDELQKEIDRHKEKKNRTDS